MTVFLGFVCLTLLITLVVAFFVIQSSKQKIRKESSSLDTTGRMIQATDVFWAGIADSLEDVNISQRIHNDLLANADLNQRLYILEDKKRLENRMRSITADSRSMTL